MRNGKCPMTNSPLFFSQLHTVHIRSPNVLVQLQLHPHLEPTLNDPVCEFLQAELLPRRRNQNCQRVLFEMVFRDDFHGKVPICTISYDKLYFVPVGMEAR